MLKFAIIGAGAGGQSMAAILTSKGYIAKLYDIDKEKIHRLQELKTIKVTGVIACEAAPAVITDRIDEVMDDVDVIMVVSTTDAHRSIAYACKPYLKDGQIVMLNPGHCGGALEIANILRGEDGCGKDLIIAEAGDLKLLRHTALRWGSTGPTGSGWEGHCWACFRGTLESPTAPELRF